jgi:hypothetical protein
MYKVDKSVNSEARTTNFLDVGIHENVELTNVRYDVSPNAGNEFIAFTFEMDGKTLIHTEYQPKDEDPEKLENKKANQIKRIKHIVTKYISEDLFVINAQNFKEFCESTIRLLGTSYVGVKVRLKVVYSFNNYTSLPNYVPFIEKMDVPKEKSGLEILSIDKMTKTQPDTERNTQTNPYESTDKSASDTNKGDNDLPF